MARETLNFSPITLPPLLSERLFKWFWFIIAHRGPQGSSVRPVDGSGWIGGGEQDLAFFGQTAVRDLTDFSYGYVW